MGQFTIQLPDGRQGDVRWGTVKKKRRLLDFFSKNKPKAETKTGYIVRMGADKKKGEEYWLFKSKAGHWSKDAEGEQELNTDLYRAIKNAISEKEQSND